MHREKHPFCFVPGKGTKTTVFPDASRKTAWGQNSDLFKNGGQNGDKKENDPCFSRCIEKNGGDKLDSMRCISPSVFPLKRSLVLLPVLYKSTWSVLQWRRMKELEMLTNHNTGKGPGPETDWVLFVGFHTPSCPICLYVLKCNHENLS